MAWLGTYQWRLPIIIPAASVGATLTNFPVLLYLSASSGINSEDLSAVFDELTADANRKKIAITTDDETTQCYVEIERWVNASNTAWLWFKAPSIPTSETTYYLYFDVDQADNDTYVGDTGSAVAQNVWNSNYVAVWHMSQTLTGAAGELLDSTSNNHDGRTYCSDSSTYPTLAASVIGNGETFDGNTGVMGGHDQYIRVEHSSLLNLDTTGLLAFQFWLNVTDVNFYDSGGNDMDYINFMGVGIGNDTPHDFEWVWTLGGENSTNKIFEMAAYAHSLDGGSGNGVGIYYNAAHGKPGWSVGDKIFYYATFNRATETMSMKGYYPLGDTQTDTSFMLDGSLCLEGTAPFMINGNWATSTDQYLKGRLDEIRILNNTPSASWFNADYNNQRDELLDFGTIVSGGEGGSSTNILAVTTTSIYGATATSLQTVSTS